jgi:tetratricopeptide (TPR) repeat protein
MALYYSVRGYVLCRTGEVDEGIQLLEKGVALDPSIRNLQNLAQQLAYNNDDRAIGVCQRILEKDHEDFSAHLSLVILAARSGDRDEALLKAQRAESLALPARDYFDMGRVYRELGEYKKALDAYGKASKCDFQPRSDLYSAMAACVLWMGNLSGAAEGAAKALDLNFNNDFAKDVLFDLAGGTTEASAIALDLKFNDDSARDGLFELVGGTTEQVSLEAVLNKLMDEHDGTCFTSILLAQKALKLKNTSEVRELLGKAKQFHIGGIYHSLQCWQEALDSCFQSERLGYHHRDRLYGAIAACYSGSEDYTSAIQYACRAIKIDFCNDRAKDVLLWCTHDGHWDPTVDDLIAEHRETALVYIILAHRALRDHKRREFRRMVKRAERANPSAAEVFDIAHLWYNLGHFKRALAACLESEELGYGAEDRLFHALAQCYHSLRDYEASIRYARKALAINPDDEGAKQVLRACTEGE